MLFTDDMLTEISRTLAVVYMYIKEIPRLKNKTLNLSVKIEKFIKQFLQIQAIFWSETCLVTTVEGECLVVYEHGSSRISARDHFLSRPLPGT
jgi:hypothetical protein